MEIPRSGGMSLVWDCPGLAPSSSERGGGMRSSCGPKEPCRQPRGERIPLSLPLSIFLRSIHDDSSDQVVGDGLIDRKLHRTFSLFVRREFFFKGLHAGRNWVKSNVILVRREVDQPFAVQFECRHVIADRLDGLGGGFPYGQPHSLKDSLDTLWEGLDVLVDRLELFLVAIHAIHPASRNRLFQPFEAPGGTEASVPRSGW